MWSATGNMISWSHLRKISFSSTLCIVKTSQHRKERSNRKYEDIITKEPSSILIGTSEYLALLVFSTLRYYALVKSPLRLKCTISWFLCLLKDERPILRQEIAASPIFYRTAVFLIYVCPGNIRYKFGNLCLDGVTNIFRRLFTV